MPHGGYHGTVKMGGRTVQQASRSDGRGGQTGGGRYRSQGYDEPKSSSQTAAQLQQQIQNQMAADTDARSAYIGAQADSRRLSNLLRQEQEQNLANQVAASFAKGNARKSDFTGNAGDKSFLGLNYGSTPTAAATVINPITGEKIVTNKVREGMTSPEYAEYMGGLYSLNPSKMEELFPFASGKTARTVAQQVMPFGNVFSTIADLYNLGKRTMQGGAQSGLQGVDTVMSTADNALSNTVDAIGSPVETFNNLKDKTMNIFEDITTKKEVPSTFTAQNKPQEVDFLQQDAFLADVPQAQKEKLNPLDSYRSTPTGSYFDTRKGFGMRMNQGGLASLNNQDYNMLMNASNFGF
jgi:hypothetical protein